MLRQVQNCGMEVMDVGVEVRPLNCSVCALLQWREGCNSATSDLNGHALTIVMCQCGQPGLWAMGRQVANVSCAKPVRRTAH